MSIACPYCKSVLTPKGLKPGKYTPKCPKCGNPFVLTVPDDESGTISVQQLVQKKPPTGAPDTVRTPAVKPGAAPTGPATDKLPPASPRPPVKTASPSAPTDKIVKGSAAKPPPKKPVSVEDAAAALLDGRDPGDVTGDFTEPDEPKPAPKPSPKPAPKPSPKIDPHATGDFTDADAPTPAKKPAPAPKVEAKADPQATGDFTDADEPAAKAPAAADATGDFTDAEADSLPAKSRKVDDTGPMATGDFTPDDDPDATEKPKAAIKAKKAKAAAEPAAGLDDVPPRLGGYEVLKVLGKGGMGAVLLGRQISLDRKVALKVMHPKIAQNPAFVARFTREAYAAAQLTHHNVVQIYDIGEERGQHFFSMEFVQGQSLMDLVKKEGKLPADVAVGYVLQAARGLRYGHNQGMVHRDIKPDNLMVNTDGVVKVADLGLVKLPSGTGPRDDGDAGIESGLSAFMQSEAGNADSNGLTRAGAVMGTPAYMSPEQSRDSAAVDARADIYSLGCSLYVLVTGRTPFEGKTALEVISKHQTEPMTPPEVIAKRVPKGLSAIVLKMTAKKPDERYQSMDDVIEALEGFLGLERAGTFNPKEEQADQLEKCCHQFNHRSKAGLKKSLALAFFAACLVGIAGSAFAGMPALAGGLLGLMVVTPLAYFVIHGTFTGSVVFPKARAVILGMKFSDWLMWSAGGVLFLATLYLFGLLWSWLGFAALAVGLAFVLWFLTDRSAVKAQEAPLEEARGLFKSLRLSGLDEEQLRQFVCKFSGNNWEPFYEALFGYEAKIAARAYRKGDTGEAWKKAGTWREPVLAWLDARLEARRVARERKHLQKVEANALEAEGVSKSEARAQAEAMAADLVDQAAEAKQARREGKEVSVLALAKAARERKKPKPGFNLAGKPLRGPWLRHFINDWFGRRLRFGVGAAVFAVGLLWMNQNELFGRENVFQKLLAMDIDGAQKSLAKAAGKPLRVPDFLPIPSDVLQMVSSVNVPVLGFLTILSALFFFGWRPTVVALLGLVVGIAGPTLGIPAVDPLSANLLSLIAGAALIVVLGWLLRQ